MHEMQRRWAFDLPLLHPRPAGLVDTTEAAVFAAEGVHSPLRGVSAGLQQQVHHGGGRIGARRQGGDHHCRMQRRRALDGGRSGGARLQQQSHRLQLACRLNNGLLSFVSLKTQPDTNLLHVRRQKRRCRHPYACDMLLLAMICDAPCTMARCSGVQLSSSLSSTLSACAPVRRTCSCGGQLPVKLDFQEASTAEVKDMPLQSFDMPAQTVHGYRECCWTQAMCMRQRLCVPDLTAASNSSTGALRTASSRPRTSVSPASAASCRALHGTICYVLRATVRAEDTESTHGRGGALSKSRTHYERLPSSSSSLLEASM